MSDDTIDLPKQAIMRGVIPYLSLRGEAAAAADFYVEAFGANDLGRMAMPEQPERIMHLQLEINGGALMMTDHIDDSAGAATAPLVNGHLQLVVGDGRRWWDRAVAAGCRELAAFEMQPWGDYWGLLLDPFGIHWAILEPGPGRTPTN